MSAEILMLTWKKPDNILLIHIKKKKNIWEAIVLTMFYHESGLDMSDDWLFEKKLVLTWWTSKSPEATFLGHSLTIHSLCRLNRSPGSPALVTDHSNH